MTWQEALQFANGSGAAVIAGVLISVLIEYWPWFQLLEQKHKVLAYVALCLFIPFMAAAAVHRYRRRRGLGRRGGDMVAGLL